MKNEMQVFSYQEKQVRTVEQGGEPWFVLKDVCDALDVSNSRMVSDRLDADEVSQAYIIDGMGRKQRTTIVNEPGLYNVILRSDKPEAKAFKRWVTHEVLPCIRKTGAYSTRPMSDYQQMMADTRQRNARIRSAQILTRLARQYEGTTYEQVLNAHATRELTGEYLLPLPKLSAKTYSAGEIGEMLGVTGNKVGTLAKRHGLKVEEYGQWFKDKSPYSNKEVPSFRYYENVLPILRELLKEQAK